MLEVVNNMQQIYALHQDGYAIINFGHTEFMSIIQNKIKSVFAQDPTEFHTLKINDDQRLQRVKQTKDTLLNEGLVKNFLLANIDSLITLFGPDIDIQSDFYLRVSRPHQENDFIDWHRDTFYGNSHWELNFWFPIFPLATGAGLMLVEGSHLVPANNICYVEEENQFRKQVAKGSIAHELGYLYARKTDDAISNLDASKIKLLAPAVGQAIIFFSHTIHRAQNISSKTRVSIDLRIKHMLAPTNTRPGYYQPLTRGIIAQHVEKMNF